MLALALIVVVALCLVTLLVTYVGYPLSLVLLEALLEPAPTPRTDHETYPDVTMVVPVHNEAAVVERKVRNTTAIEYPGQFRCLFVSDSTDDTDERLERAIERYTGSDSDTGDEPDVSLLTLAERRGKSHAINRALEEVDAPLVVFSDGNTMYEPNAVTALVAPLADERIGCVTGRLDLSDDGDDAGETAYWRYELWLRRLEAGLGTTVSVNGGLLAARRRDIDPLPEAALTDDFVLAMEQARAGRRIYYEPSAVGTEYTTGSVAGEFKRRVRIGVGNVQSLAWFADLLRPKYGRLAFQFLGHKVLRWLQPWILLVTGIASIAGILIVGSPVWMGLIGLEAGAMALAIIGIASDWAARWRPFRLPAFFLAMNAALGLGWFRALTGRTTNIWGETTRGS